MAEQSIVIRDFPVKTFEEFVHELIAAINQVALNLLLKPTVKLKDARTIPPEQLYERRKQAISNCSF